MNTKKLFGLSDTDEIDARTLGGEGTTEKPLPESVQEQRTRIQKLLAGNRDRPQ